MHEQVIKVINCNDLRNTAIRARNGDIESVKLICVLFRPLVFKSAYRFFGTCVERDELIQEGYASLVRLIAEWDPSNGTEISGYLKVKLPWMVLDAARRLRRHRDRQSAIDEDFDIPDSMNENSFEEIEKPAWEQIIEPLKEQERKVIEMYYKEELSESVIGKKMQISQQRVNKVRNNAISKCRESLISSGWQ